MIDRGIKALTGLRFAAAFSVVFMHFAPLLAVRPDNWAVVLGGGAVPLFFVLSGFVLTAKYREIVRREGLVSLRRYAVARFARIAPVYYVVLVATVVAYLLTDNAVSLGGTASEGEWFVSLLFNALLLQAWSPNYTIQQYWNAPSWSIGVEILFYMLLPLAWRNLRLPISAATIVGILVFHTLIQLGGKLVFTAALSNSALVDGYLARMPLMSVMYFAMGMILAQRFHSLPPEERCQEVRIPIVLLLLSATMYEVWRANSLITLLVTQVLWFGLFAWIIEALANERTKSLVGSLLSTKPMVVFGQASYSLYLIHWLPLGFALNLLPVADRGSTGSWLLMGAVVFASLVVFYLIEEPARRWFRAWGTDVRNPN